MDVPVFLVGTNPVTSTTYNAAGQVTDSTLGTGDSDHYQYDANTGLMNQYKFTVGATPQNVIGQVNWNPNGSLGSLGITDPFNPANSQTCNYTHDDLSRIATVSCGSIWSQSFGFDPFGNINKTGSQSFTPTYSNSTNQINGGGYSQSYDANGNLLTINDGTTHTYTWDAEGRQLGIDTLSATYDALGRMVELNSSGSYTETVYGLASEKLALMNGQTLQKSFVATPSGTAVFTASGLSYFRHADWLGSSRFASTTGRTMYSSSAYAPFGEQYAKSGTNDQSFTGQQPDTTAGLYDFLFRRLSQTQGRWISPDPAGIGAVDPAAPQTWNRYAYVTNNPLRFADQFGLVKGPCSVIGINCDGLEGGGSGWSDYFGYGDCASFYMDGLLYGSGCNSTDVSSGQEQDSGTDGTDSKSASAASNNQKNCPPPAVQTFYRWLLSLVAGDVVTLGQEEAWRTDAVVQLGSGVSASYANEIALGFGWSGSVSAAFAFDPQGNIGLAINRGHGPSFGSGIVVGIQASQSNNAHSIFDLNGPSISRGAGYGDGVAAAWEWSTNAGGTRTSTLGVGAGGFGAFRTAGPTTVIPLVCK